MIDLERLQEMVDACKNLESIFNDDTKALDKARKRLQESSQAYKGMKRNILVYVEECTGIKHLWL